MNSQKQQRKKQRVSQPAVRRRTRRTQGVRAATTRVSECGQRYAKCVLDPVAGFPAKVPDGAAASVLIEYDLSVNGTPDASGNLSFAMVPGLPCAAWGGVGTFTGPNREGASTTTAYVPVNAQWALFPFADFSSGISPAVQGSNIQYNAPLEIEAARVVSYKLEVTPTGALLQQGGVAATARVPLQFFQQEIGFLSTTSIRDKVVAANSGSPAFAMYERLPNGYSSLSAFPDVKVCPGTEACVIMGIPSDDDFWPVIPGYRLNASSSSPPGTTLIAGDTAIYTSGVGTRHYTADATKLEAYFGALEPYAAMLPSNVADTNLFGNFWQPDECQGLMWAGQSLPTGQSYTFRVRACMELMVSHAASSYRPFVTPPEADDPLARKLVRDVIRVAPVSMPRESSSPGWWSKLGQAASGIAGAVSALGIPVVSPVAGLANKFMNALGL